MTARLKQCTAISIEGGEPFTAYIDQPGPSLLLLTIADGAASDAWTFLHSVPASPLVFIAQASPEHLAQLLTQRSGASPDRAEIARQAKSMIIRRRRLRSIDLPTARVFYRAAEAIPLTEQVDEMPEAILEMLYGGDWRNTYPRMPAPDFDAVLRKVIRLQAALTQMQASPASCQRGSN